MKMRYKRFSYLWYRHSMKEWHKSLYYLFITVKLGNVQKTPTKKYDFTTQRYFPYVVNEKQNKKSSSITK